MSRFLILGLLAGCGLWAIAAGMASSWRLVPLASPSVAVSQKMLPTGTVAAPARDSEDSDHGSQSELDAIMAETDAARQDALLKKWADSIDVAALSETIENANSIQNPALRAKVQAALLGSWGQRDMPGALTWFAHRGGADPLQEQARDILAQVMANSNPSAMLVWMQAELPETARSELYGPLFRQWAKNSPAAAAAQLHLMTESATPATASEWNDILGQVAAQWAHANLYQALDWVKTLPAGPGRSSALWQMSDQWTTADPYGAANYAAQQKDAELINRVAGKWAEKDPQSAASWAATLPVGSEQESATARVATIWAEDDPVRAATYVAGLPNGSTQASAALGVVSMWAQSAPADTAQWVSSFPEGATRDQAVRALVSTWALVSGSDAGQWVENLPGGNSRDIAIAAFTSATDVSSPAQAFQLALTVSDPKLRDKQVEEVASAWMRKDPVGAHAAIAQSTLSPEIKNSLSSSALSP